MWGEGLIMRLLIYRRIDREIVKWEEFVGKER